MGRTNPKLASFLKENLEMNRFRNLNYEFGDVFNIELPRYDKDKCADFEAILKAWYEYNGKLNKYIGYSNGKSVLQAALKKSVYLISLPSIGGRLRFRFAASNEVKENKRLLKEKTKKDQPPRFLEPFQPPSPTESFQASSPSASPSIASSGYISESDCEGDMHVADMQMQDVLWNDFKIIDDIVDCGALDDLFNYIDIDDAKENIPFSNIQPGGILPLQKTESDAFKPLEEIPEFIRPVTELKTIPVGMPGSVKKYWLCTQKVKVKSTLQLICELKVIENENSGIKEGMVVIPNDVFEPGVDYELKKSFELDDMQYFFFSPNS